MVDFKFVNALQIEYDSRFADMAEKLPEYDGSAASLSKLESDCAKRILAAMLCDKLGCRADELHFEKGERGKPFLSNNPCFFSVSHSGGFVAVAVADEEIGIDIETIKQRRQSVEKRVFNESEIKLIAESTDCDEAFYRLWTLKESYLKAIGTGFNGNAKEICFSSLGNFPQANKDGFEFKSEIIDGCAVAICLQKLQ